MSYADEYLARRERLGFRSKPVPPSVGATSMELCPQFPQVLSNIVETEPQSVPEPQIVCSICGGEIGSSVPTIRKIQQVVARHYNVTVGEICSPRRTNKIVRIRHLAIYLCRTMTTRSTNEIGRLFGGRDHTTIMSAEQKFERLISENPQVAAEVEAVKSTIV